MHVVLSVFAAVVLAAHAIGLVELRIGYGKIGRLPGPGARREPFPPSVSIVVAARDEAHGIEAALRSWLAQDHPDIELVIVDDRSSDGTGDVVRRVAAGDPRVRLLRIDELPRGWLGKSHALMEGASRASGRYLLFSDADVELAPHAVGAALAYARSRAVDHLTAAPRIRASSWPLALLVGTFAVLFARFTRPWRAADPRSRAYIGIGAFNLVRRDAYVAAGGHAAIRMRVDDDLRLGEALKRRGFHQEFVHGRDALSVEWYPSLGAMVRGLEKNAFAGLEYRLSLVVLLSLAIVATSIAPFALLPFAESGATRAMLGASAAAVVAVHARAAREAGVALWPALLAPLGHAVFLWTLWRSTAVTLRRRGVSWRDTHYSLEELRAAAERPEPRPLNASR